MNGLAGEVEGETFLSVGMEAVVVFTYYACRTAFSDFPGAFFPFFPHHLSQPSSLHTVITRPSCYHLYSISIILSHLQPSKISLLCSKHSPRIISRTVCPPPPPPPPTSHPAAIPGSTPTRRGTRTWRRGWAARDSRGCRSRSRRCRRCIAR